MIKIEKKSNSSKIAFFVLTMFLFSIFSFTCKKNAQADEADVDYDAYQKYELYLKYEKKQKYNKYEKYKKYKKKYGFDNSAEKTKTKDAYEKYKLYKKNPSKYPSYSLYYDQYKKYSKYKKYYTPYKKYSRYGKYESYDKSEYDAGKNYGGDSYKEGHDRYLRSQENSGLGEATLGGGALGPEIAIGIYNYTKSDLRDETYIRVKANKSYLVKNETGQTLATLPADTYTRIQYLSDGDLKVYESMTEANAGSNVYFESADGDNSTIIFDLNRPSSDYDQYRGKIKAHFYDSSESDGDRIWIINTLPLEHYVWGIGEITGTGDADYNKAMTTIFRTYGYWKLRWSTQYIPQGFVVVNTSANQIYHGYNWEEDHPNIKSAAIDTQGKIMMYGGEIALSPYSSWTDGRTRSFEERWGSTLYPWCRSVTDSYGKHPTKSTTELEAEGNHMVGLSANGALSLATDHNWNWDDILRYYFYKVRFLKAY